jgi:hypothetical protein
MNNSKTAMDRIRILDSEGNEYKTFSGTCSIPSYSSDEKEKQPVMIEIPFEEYKELLMIKGKYEELKSSNCSCSCPKICEAPKLYPTITYTGSDKD